MIIKVANEIWFKQAPYYHVKMLGIKHLGVPAERFETKNQESSKRALVRQVYRSKYDKYGIEFEIPETTTVTKRRTANNNTLTGEYTTSKIGLRAPKEDVRWELLAIIQKNKTFEEVIASVEEKYGEKHQFPTTGEMTFDIQSFLSWSIKRGWIIKL